MQSTGLCPQSPQKTMSPNTDPIPFARPELGREEEEAVLRVLRSGWLTTASEAAAFEEEFSEAVESPYALALNSCTAALHLGLEAFGVGPGDYVITSPYTFTATAEVIRYLGAHPIFCDVEVDGYNIDHELLEQAIQEAPARPKAIIPVHIGGRACDMKRIMSIAENYGIKVLEDAAHAFPARSNDGKWSGTSGHAGAYSFYANKTITTGEGGMLVTPDPRIAERVRLMRLHGIDREIWNRYTDGNSSWRYAVVEAGYKYNMPDMAAAIGRVQLKKAFTFRAMRESIARRYSRAFSACRNSTGEERFILPKPTDGGFENHAWHLYLLRIAADEHAASSELEKLRDRCIEALRSQGIGSSVHYVPLHIMPYYQRTYGLKAHDFPRAYNHFQGVISLPIYPSMREEQVDRVIAAVENMT